MTTIEGLMTTPRKGTFHGFRRCATSALALLAGSLLLTSAGAKIASAQTESQPTYARIGGGSSAQEIPIPHLLVAEVFSGQVLGVIDDRTLVVKRDSAPDHQERVHLFGLQTPDGTRARKYLNDNLKSKNVRVEARRRETDGTLEAVVTLVQDNSPRNVLQPVREIGGIHDDVPRGINTNPQTLPAPQTPLNVTLVRLGLARTDPRIAKLDAAFNEQLTDAENGARKDKNGLWAEATNTASSAEMPLASSPKR